MARPSRELTPRVRRARTLLVYWDRDRFLIENYRTHRAIIADAVSLHLLHVLADWCHPNKIVKEMPQDSRQHIRSILNLLRDYTILVEEDTPEARQDATIARVWSHWLPHGSFHFGTKDTPFARGNRRENLVQSRLAESPQPAFFKNYPRAIRVPLPPCSTPSGEFLKVLLERTTHRDFAPKSLPLSALARLLYFTWGVQGYRVTPFGRLAHKTSPSGGARHPGEVYVLALKVEGLDPGIYHYDCRRHRLEILHLGKMRSKAVAYCAGQTYVRNAAALFLMTAAFRRSMWKYRFARAYRVVMLDAGHLCQTFCLIATFLGLAPFCTAALQDTLIEKDLGLDGINESVLYVAGVGVTRTNR